MSRRPRRPQPAIRGGRAGTGGEKNAPRRGGMTRGGSCPPRDLERGWAEHPIRVVRSRSSREGRGETTNRVRTNSPVAGLVAPVCDDMQGQDGVRRNRGPAVRRAAPVQPGRRGPPSTAASSGPRRRAAPFRSAPRARKTGRVAVGTLGDSASALDFFNGPSTKAAGPASDLPPSSGFESTPKQSADRRRFGPARRGAATPAAKRPSGGRPTR